MRYVFTVKDLEYEVSEKEGKRLLDANIVELDDTIENQLYLIERTFTFEEVEQLISALDCEDGE